MVSSNRINPTPWENRWDRPKINQLIQPLKPHQKKPFEQLLSELDSSDELEHSLQWFGASWKWTIQIHPRGKPNDPLCYLVPDLESPKVFFPLTGDRIESLPMRRLSKYIRDGIKAAKCALETHWAVWSPASKGEVALLLDLVGLMSKATPEPVSKPKRRKAG